MNTGHKEKFLYAAVAIAATLSSAVSIGCDQLPFCKISYGTGKQIVTDINVEPIELKSTIIRYEFFVLVETNYAEGLYEFNMTDPLLADCAGFWFLSNVTNPSALTLYEMGGTGTRYWCSGKQAMRQYFDGSSVTVNDGWKPTVELRCTNRQWLSESSMLHGSNVQIDRIECNTMAQQYGPCTRTD